MLSTLNHLQVALPRIIVTVNRTTTTTVKPPQEKKSETQKKIEKAQQYFLTGCSYGGIGMASMMGAYNGKRVGMSPMGCLIQGFINGMGGGSMRDMLQGKRVYWLEKPIFAWWCFGTALAGTFLWDPMKRVFGISEKDKWALAISLCSLGGCTCGGAQAGLNQGSGGFYGQPIKGAIYAMFCAVGGGVIHSALVGKRPAICYDEGFANILPAGIGAVTYQLAHYLKFPAPFVAGTGFTTAVGLRLWLADRYAKRTAAIAKAAAQAASKQPQAVKK